jgi:hypothetical protein
VVATFADLAGVSLPHDAAEDSFSFAPVLLGAPATASARTSLVNDSMMGLYSIREGPWKLIVGQGGGGSYSQERPTPKGQKKPQASGAPSDTDDDGASVNPKDVAAGNHPNPAEPPGQLYNLDDDLGEAKNLYNEKPEIVARLTALLEKIRNDGRSRP